MRKSLVITVSLIILVVIVGAVLVEEHKRGATPTTTSITTSAVTTSSSTVSTSTSHSVTTSPATTTSSRVLSPTTTTTTTVTQRGVSKLSLTPVPVKYAKLFKLWKLGSYIVARDAKNNTFLLVPRGVQEPSKSEVSELAKLLGVDESSIHVVRVPVRKVVYLSTTEVALLYRLAVETNHLDLLRTIVGVTFKSPWFFPEVQQLVNNGTIKLCGSMSGIDYERVLKLEPDIVVTYTGTKNSDVIYEKLKSLGITVVVDNEWLEQSYLGRFEWIKFIAAFYGEEALNQAIRIFDNAEKTLLELEKEFGNKTSEVRFLWFTPTVKYGVWAPKTEAYPIKFLEKLGGVYVLENLVPKGTGSTRINKEAIATTAKNADVIIIASYPPYIKSINDVARIVGDWFLEIPAVKNHRVYFYTPSYWQLGYAYTEKVLMDLASILHPEALKNPNSILYGHVRTFFHHLWKNGETLELEYCKGFRVVYKGFYKLVTDYTNNTWIVVPFDCANQVPKEDLAGARGVIRIPLKKIAAGRCGASRVLGLGYGDLIVGATGSTINYLPEKLRSKVTSFGCVYKGLNLEKLVELKPDVYIGGAALARRPQLISKIVDELGIPVIAISDSTEYGALSLVEVSKLVASLLDVEEVAEKLLEENVKELKAIEKSIDQAISKTGNRPTALYLYYYKGRFGIARGGEPRAQLLTLAGAEYALKGNETGWMKISIEDFISKFKDVDWIVWTYPRVKSVDDILKIDPRLEVIKAVKEHHVIIVLRDDYCIVMKYDLASVVKDLASIMYPELFPNHKPVYFGRVT